MAPRAAYYLSTPIYYVNDSPHIGHAYTSLACDVLARFMRLDGRDVLFLTGTDEHGQKVQKSAVAAGMEPQTFVDRVSERFRALGEVMGYSNDDFIRTTEPRHTRSCQELWRRIADNGHIYLGKYAGWYSVREEAFYAESEVTTGPDGGRVTAADGSPVEWVEEPSYFFRLSAWQEPLLDFYERNPQAVAPESRRNEVISFVAGGLNDLSISRASLNWGIPVPGDPDHSTPGDPDHTMPGHTMPGHTMYVWLDALTNYISGAGFPDTDSNTWRTYWPADLHMVGKDILRFHAVYWPAFLMAAGIEPPTRVFAHGWWTIEGRKMSKSLGNAIDPHHIVARYGLDAVRYFLLRALPFGSDGDFSHRAIVGRMNDDLANDYGNLAQRVLTMINRNCAAAVPEPGAFEAADRVLLDAAEALVGTVRADLSAQAFHRALIHIWEVVGQANRYVDEQAPWALRKSDPARMATVLYVVAETLRHLAVLTQSFMPGSSGYMLDQIGVAAGARQLAALGPGGRLVPGTPLPKPAPIFPRFVEDSQDS